MDRPPPAPRSLRKRAAAVGSASHAYGTTLGDLLVSAPLFSPLLSGVGAEGRVRRGSEWERRGSWACLSVLFAPLCVYEGDERD